MKIYSIVFVFITLSLVSTAQVDPIDANGLAIGGYDIVSYFTIGKAVKGNPEISSKVNNATYHFSSRDNQKIFTANPQKFLPQYEGFCALAVGTTAKKISIDPETFKITDGKLYLFYNAKTWSGKTFNSLEPWIKDESKLIKKANELWPEVKQKKYTMAKR